MLRLVLAEDSPTDEAAIRSYLERFFEERAIDGVVRCYSDGKEMLEAGPPQADMYLLDIEMPGADGFAVARAVRANNPDAPICFITSLAQLAPAGYEVDAMGFLIKPLSYEALRRTFDRALTRIDQRRSNLVALREAKNERFVDARSITYAETKGKHTLVHLTDSCFDCSESLKALEEKVADGSMFRIHNAYLVNLCHVDSATPLEVTVGGSRLPLSRHRKKAFFSALASYIGCRP